MPRIDERVIRSQSEYIDISDVSRLLDPDTCPKAFLPFLAYMLHADTFSEGLMGEEYDRQSIRSAHEINIHRGTRHAVDVFADNVGVTHTIEKIRAGNPERVTEIVICVNETSRDGVQFVDFLTRTYKSCLLYTSPSPRDS